jgi:hypothetical protein
VCGRARASERARESESPALAALLSLAACKSVSKRVNKIARARARARARAGERDQPQPQLNYQQRGSQAACGRSRARTLLPPAALLSVLPESVCVCGKERERERETPKVRGWQ